MNVPVNYVAVVLAAVAGMIIGAGWYAGPVFGNAWMKLAGLHKEDTEKSAVLVLGGAFVLTLVIAYVLYTMTFIMQRFVLDTFFVAAIQTAFLLWLGMVAPIIVMHGLFERRRKKLLLLTAAHELVALLVMGVVIGVVGF